MFKLRRRKNRTKALVSENSIRALTIQYELLASPFFQNRALICNIPLMIVVAE